MNNFQLMRMRLEQQGGIRQEERMIKGKYQTFLRALEYSYQAVNVSLSQKHDECVSAVSQFVSPIVYKALINPNHVKQDYDDKVLSIDYKSGFESGDVFEWRGTKSYWIVYLEELTEDAYFRGSIRRCKYKIKFKDEDGNWLQTWAAIRGPIETQINSIQKNQVRVDRPNLSLNILIPRNNKTLLAFDRYKEFLFAGRSWRVEAPDSISMTNIIEIAAEESFVDRNVDDQQNDMKNGLIVERVDPTPTSGIIGETWIKPLIEYTYMVEDKNEQGGIWQVPEDCPVKLSNKTGITTTIVWQPSTQGQFELRWISEDETKVYTKTIVAESLF